MKELSIEQKAERYDEALKWMENVYPTLSHEQQMEAEAFFPIFKESEDERIRKELLEHCKSQAEPYIQTGNECPQIQSWIAWLEKQDKQKPVELSYNEKNLVDIVTKRMLKENPIPELKGKEKADFENEFNRFKQITGMINWPAREEIYKKVILWFIAWSKDHLSIGTIENDSEIDKPVEWSEDEKIRTKLLNLLKELLELGGVAQDTWSMNDCEQFIVWLEKQRSKSNWYHHEVDLSNCSKEYRKAYYDGWYNCSIQHSQCKSDRNDVVKCLINGMKFYYEDNKEATWGTEKFSMKVKDILSWLEEQGEKLTLPIWKYKNDNIPLSRDSIILNKYGCVAKSPSGALVDDVWVLDYAELAKLPKEEIEEQGEKKTKEERYPQRFMVDDIIKYNGTEYKITSIESNGYRVYPLTYDEDAASLISFGAPATLVEQKPADKVGSEFHEGDWITNGEEIGKVIEWNHPDCIGYKTNYGVEKAFNKKDISKWHKWTIQEAKNGDVLVTLGCILIFEKLLPKGGGVSYCHYDFVSSTPQFDFTKDHNWYFGKEAKVYPATKEQRDALEKIMADAGYTFDFEKKELKKIEQDPWGEEDKKMFVNIKACLRNANRDYSREVDWLKSIKPQSKNEWGGDDEEKRKNCIYWLEKARKYFEQDEDLIYENKWLIKCIAWLKSLRPQNKWKPSGTEINVLQGVIDGSFKPENVKVTLTNILEQLKTL